MKKRILSTLFAVLATVLTAFAQSGYFNYQGVARNSTGAPLANQAIQLRISIIDNNSSGPNLYTETHTTNTNAYGLYNVAIGNGSTVSGNFDNISWGDAAKFIKVEMDPTGGTSYQDLGTSELNSVPYAKYALATPPSSRLPIAYGYVSSSAALSADYPSGMIVTNPSTGRYEIEIPGENFYYSDYATSVTIAGTGAGMTRTGSTSGRLIVYTYNSSGTLTNLPFNFVVFKP